MTFFLKCNVAVKLTGRILIVGTGGPKDAGQPTQV